MNRRDFFRRALGLAVGLIGVRGVPIVNGPKAVTPKLLLTDRVVMPRMTKEEWMALDASVLRAASLRLRSLFGRDGLPTLLET